MKLDAKHFRYLTPDDWRVLTAFEMGSKNHEVVPTPLAIQLSALKTGTNSVNRSISALAKAGLIAKVKNAKYDGYRLSYGGYDYLALNALTRSDAVLRLGSTLGVGKESDVILVTSPAPDNIGKQVQAVLKVHRLGRISFRSISNNRAYLGKRSHTSWQYLSRLSAHREFCAMQILYDTGFKVPRPIGHNRHAIVMSLVPGLPLRAVPLTAYGVTRRVQERNVSVLFAELIEIVLALAERGIIHGDMNEFNVMLEGVQVEQEYPDHGVDEDLHEEKTALEEAQEYAISDRRSLNENEDEQEDESTGEDDGGNLMSITPHIIDFPQIISMSHVQAHEYFERDVNGIKAFFRKRYHFIPDNPGPTFDEAGARLETASARGVRRIDIQTEAAGFCKKDARHLDAYYASPRHGEDDVEIDLTAEDEHAQGTIDDEVVGSLKEKLTDTGLSSSKKSKSSAGWAI